eukprot:Hpha_TRINITY_DN16885_c0_g3::TRINITY_DN16885_c0_g3_i1::g.151125::m.151125
MPLGEGVEVGDMEEEYEEMRSPRLGATSPSGEQAMEEELVGVLERMAHGDLPVEGSVTVVSPTYREPTTQRREGRSERRASVRELLRSFSRDGSSVAGSDSESVATEDFGENEGGDLGAVARIAAHVIRSKDAKVRRCGRDIRKAAELGQRLLHARHEGEDKLRKVETERDRLRQELAGVRAKLDKASSELIVFRGRDEPERDDEVSGSDRDGVSPRERDFTSLRHQLRGDALQEKSRRKEAEEQLRAFQRENSDLKEEMSSLREQLEQSEDALVRTQASLASEKRSAGELHARYNQLLQESANSSKRELSPLPPSIDTPKALVGEEADSSQPREKQALLYALRTELERRAERIELLQEENEALRLAMVERPDPSPEHESETLQLREDNLLLNKNALDLHEQLQELKERIKDSDRDRLLRETECEEHLERLKDSERDRLLRETECEEHRVQLIKELERVALLEAEMNTSRDVRQRLEGERVELRGKVRGLEQVGKRVQLAITSLPEQVRGVRVALESLKRAAVGCRARCEEWGVVEFPELAALEPHRAESDVREELRELNRKKVDLDNRKEKTAVLLRVAQLSYELHRLGKQHPRRCRDAESQTAEEAPTISPRKATKPSPNRERIPFRFPGPSPKSTRGNVTVVVPPSPERWTEVDDEEEVEELDASAIEKALLMERRRSSVLETELQVEKGKEMQWARERAELEETCRKERTQRQQQRVQLEGMVDDERKKRLEEEKVNVRLRTELLELRRQELASSTQLRTSPSPTLSPSTLASTIPATPFQSPPALHLLQHSSTRPRPIYSSESSQTAPAHPLAASTHMSFAPRPSHSASGAQTDTPPPTPSPAGLLHAEAQISALRTVIVEQGREIKAFSNRPAAAVVPLVQLESSIQALQRPTPLLAQEVVAPCEARSLETPPVPTMQPRHAGTYASQGVSVSCATGEPPLQEPRLDGIVREPPLRARRELTTSRAQGVVLENGSQTEVPQRSEGVFARARESPGLSGWCASSPTVHQPPLHPRQADSLAARPPEPERSAEVRRMEATIGRLSEEVLSLREEVSILQRRGSPTSGSFVSAASPASFRPSREEFSFVQRRGSPTSFLSAASPVSIPRRASPPVASSPNPFRSPSKGAATQYRGAASLHSPQPTAPRAYMASSVGPPPSLRTPTPTDLFSSPFLSGGRRRGNGV